MISAWSATVKALQFHARRSLSQCLRVWRERPSEPQAWMIWNSDVVVQRPNPNSDPAPSPLAQAQAQPQPHRDPKRNLIHRHKPIRPLASTRQLLRRRLKSTWDFWAHSTQHRGSIQAILVHLNYCRSQRPNPSPNPDPNPDFNPHIRNSPNPKPKP